jgi:hypothetical protein
MTLELSMLWKLKTSQISLMHKLSRIMTLKNKDEGLRIVNNNPK